MRYRIKDYRIDGQSIVLPDKITIEDLRIVINETQCIVLCSSMQKEKIQVSDNTIFVPSEVCTLLSTDKLTIEIDKGDNLASEIMKLTSPPTATLEDDGYYTIDFGSANITIE